MGTLTTSTVERRTIRRPRYLAVALSVALLAAACGGGDDDAADSSATDAAPSAASTPAGDSEPSTAASGATSEATSGASSAPESTSAASEGGGEVSVPSADEEYRITLIPGVVGDEFYVSMECGARAAAEEAGVSFDVQGGESFDPTVQIPILEAVISDGPDAIMIAPTDSQSLQAPIQAAVDAGITVVLVDTTLDDPSVAVSQVSSDNVAGGEQAAETLGGLIDGEGAALVVNVRPGITTTDQRQQGFESGIEGVDRITYLGAEFSNNEPAQAAAIVAATVAAEPDLAGIFATNLFSAEGSATGLRQANAAEVAIVGFDAGPAQVDQLEEGLVQALIAQQPGQIGRAGLAQAVTALNGGEPDAQITTGFVSITADNLEDQEVQDALYQSDC